MNRKLLLLLSLVVILASACKKSTNSQANTALSGKWIVKGTDGSGPAGTLNFTTKNGKDVLVFDCSGSPGPGWPSQAESEYKLVNDKLSFINYYDPGMGYYNADSFTWITNGQEFEIKRRQLLFFMAADYTIRYVRAN